MKTMMTYICKEQETNLRVFNNRLKLFESILKVVKGKQYERVVIYATGSSSNAAESARLYMQKILKVPVEIQEPSMAKNYEPMFTSRYLYFAISQGGQSYSTIEIVKTIQEYGIDDIFVVTSDLDSSIAKIANHVLELGIGYEEVPFVTIGYSATIVFFNLLSLEIAKLNNVITVEEYEYEIYQIHKVILSIDSVIQKSNKWYLDNEKELAGAKRFVSIGFGAGYGVIKEAETKLTETVRVPTHGHELEAFMHGPYIGLSHDDYIFLLEQNGILKERQRLLRKFLKNHTKHTYLISTDGICEYESDLCFEVEVPELLSPILTCIPIQIMSWKLSVVHSVDLTKSSYPDFDEMLKSKV